MLIVRHRVLIKIGTEYVDGKIEASVQRPDKFKSTYYDSISLLSVDRLRKLMRHLKSNGYEIYGGRGEGANFAFAIELQKSY